MPVRGLRHGGIAPDYRTRERPIYTRHLHAASKGQRLSQTQSQPPSHGRLDERWSPPEEVRKPEAMRVQHLRLRPLDEGESPLEGGWKLAAPPVLRAHTQTGGLTWQRSRRSERQTRSTKAN